jgi:uncharacterized protein (DUF736 family)
MVNFFKSPEAQAIHSEAPQFRVIAVSKKAGANWRAMPDSEKEVMSSFLFARLNAQWLRI